MRPAMRTILLAFGALLVALALPAGYLNRTVLDTPTFASRVDDLRRREDVSAVLGRDVSRQIVKQNPDLVAVAPLVEQISIGVIRSDLLSGPVRLAASQFQRALTTRDSDQLVLRVADVGAVVASALTALDSERAPAGPEVAATLVAVGSQDFAHDVIDVATRVGTLAWLLPLLALICFIGAVLLHSNRWNGLRRVGWSVIIGAASTAIVIVIGSVIIRRAGGDARTDAMLDGIWEVFVRPFWWVVGSAAAIGALLVMVGSGRPADWNMSAVARRAVAPPSTARGIVIRAVAFVAAGIFVIMDSQASLVLAAWMAGALLMVSGLATLAVLAAGSIDDSAPVDDASGDAPDGSADGSAGNSVRFTVIAISIAVFAGLVVWAARPVSDELALAAGDVVAGTGEVCNGHAELCDRPFDEVSFAATHNSMAVAGKPGWFIGEQGLDIVPQLDFGVRALLIDVWYGLDAGNGAVRTSARSYEEALAVANEELGPEIVAAALRVVDAVAPGEAQGAESLYMCHGLCETGATPFDATLNDIRAWLAAHPDEVVTLFIEDHVEADDVGRAVEAARLSDFAYVPVNGETFPTLGEMIRTNKRLVVMLEAGDGRPTYPWLVNGFEFVQETPYKFATIESFSCEPNRGPADAPLLQINHWLAGFTQLVTNAQQVNTAEFLGQRVRRCREERGQQPTFVAVNYADIGDLISVVDELNGVD